MVVPASGNTKRQRKSNIDFPNNKQQTKSESHCQTTNNTTTQQHNATMHVHAHATGNRRQETVDFASTSISAVLCCVALCFMLCCCASLQQQQGSNANRKQKQSKHNTSVVHSTLDTRQSNWKLEIGNWNLEEEEPIFIVHRASCIVQSVVRRPYTSHVTCHTSRSPRRQLVNSSSAFVSLRLACLGVLTCLDSSSFLIAFKSGIATAVIFKTAKRHSRCLGITKAKNSTWMMWIALLFVVAVLSLLFLFVVVVIFYVSCLVPRSCLVWSFWILRAKKTSRANYTRHSARSTPMVVS